MKKELHLSGEHAPGSFRTNYYFTKNIDLFSTQLKCSLIENSFQIYRFKNPTAASCFLPYPKVYLN